MSQTTNIASAMLRLVTASNNLKSMVGTTTDLTTTAKSNLVVAINEVRGLVTAGSATIDDLASGTGTTWSSSKIQIQITAAVTALINGSDTANDTLKELADRITAVAQADAGLLSLVAAQTFTAGEQLQGCTNIGIGDPTHNYVTAIELNLVAGL